MRHVPRSIDDSQVRGWDRVPKSTGDLYGKSHVLGAMEDQSGAGKVAENLLRVGGTPRVEAAFAERTEPFA